MVFTKPTPSSSCCVRTEVVLPTFVIPFPTSPFQNLLGGRRRGVDRALFRGLNECVRAELPGRFHVWTSTPLLLRDEPSRINAFCTLSICSCVLSRVKWARKLFRSSALARSTIIWVSPGYRRSPRVHLHHSENRMSLCLRQLLMRRVWRASAET